MKKLLSLFLVLPIFSTAQGIKFEEALTWDQVKLKAKEENKYIFVDCFATWCKPCKEMDLKIFPNEEVSKFLNSKFVCVKLQMDSTKNDSYEIKNGYTIAREFESNYGVKEFPTYLFFNSSGKLLHKEIGAVKKPEEFVKKAVAALDPNQQYYTLLDKYKTGNRDKDLLTSLAELALKLNEKVTLTTLPDDYIKSLENSFQKENILLINRLTTKSTCLGFKLFATETKRINNIVGEKWFSENVVIRILNYEMYMQFIDGNEGEVDWNGIKKAIKAKVPFITDELVIKMKVDDATRKKSWEQYGIYLLEYYSKYGHKENPFWMNNNLWRVFEKCNNKKTLRKAAVWSKKTIYQMHPGKEDHASMDTYANLLYKSGQKQKAIEWEQKAMYLAEKENSKDDYILYSETQNKMRQGLPTWKN